MANNCCPGCGTVFRSPEEEYCPICLTEQINLRLNHLLRKNESEEEPGPESIMHSVPPLVIEMAGEECYKVALSDGPCLGEISRQDNGAFAFWPEPLPDCWDEVLILTIVDKLQSLNA